MTKDVIYFITKEIMKVYDELSTHGNIIDNKEKYKLICKLKELIKNESEIYSYLTYDEISEVRQFFVDDYSEGDELISERIIGKIDEIILNKYMDEFYLAHEDDNYDDEDKCFDKKSILYANAIIRDLFYLKLYFLKKIYNNDGYIGNNIFLNDYIIKLYINSVIFSFCSIYPYIEKEFIENDFEFNDFVLISNLSCQLSLFDYYVSREVKNDVLEEGFIKRLDELFKINKDNLLKNGGEISFVDSLVHVFSVLLLNKEYVRYVLDAFKNNNNIFIFNILKENIESLLKDKDNIKVLSLRKR